MVGLDIFEEAGILLCCVIPAEILGHSIVYQTFPARFVSKTVQDVLRNLQNEMRTKKSIVVDYSPKLLITWRLIFIIKISKIKFSIQ
jgi:hypothetical protein